MTAIFSALHLREGESVKFLTLTVPNISDPSEMLDSLIAGFRRLRQRRWFRAKCRGGLTFVEVTGKPGDWHVHLHAIIVSRYLPVWRIARDWSFVSPGKIVHITRIPPRVAAGYVTKYSLKTVLPLDDQLAVSDALKGRRLFQPFGDLSSISSSIRVPPAVCSVCEHNAWAYDSGQGAIRALFGKSDDGNFRLARYFPNPDVKT